MFTCSIRALPTLVFNMASGIETTSDKRWTRKLKNWANRSKLRAIVLKVTPILWQRYNTTKQVEWLNSCFKTVLERAIEFVASNKHIFPSAEPLDSRPLNSRIYVCRKCGEREHYAKTCGLSHATQRYNRSRRYQAKARARRRQSKRVEASKRVCKKCGERGHYAKTCAGWKLVKRTRALWDELLDSWLQEDACSFNASPDLSAEG